MVALITAAGLTANRPIPKGPNKIQECCGSHWSPKALPQNLECLLWHGAGAWRPGGQMPPQGARAPKGGVARAPKSSTGGGLCGGLGQWASTRAAWPALTIGLAGTAPTMQAPKATWVGLGGCVGTARLATGGGGHQLYQGPGLGGGHSWGGVSPRAKLGAAPGGWLCNLCPTTPLAGHAARPVGAHPPLSWGCNPMAALLWRDPSFGLQIYSHAATVCPRFISPPSPGSCQSEESIYLPILIRCRNGTDIIFDHKTSTKDSPKPFLSFFALPNC